MLCWSKVFRDSWLCGNRRQGCCWTMVPEERFVCWRESCRAMHLSVLHGNLSCLNTLRLPTVQTSRSASTHGSRDHGCGPVRCLDQGTHHNQHSPFNPDRLIWSFLFRASSEADRTELRYLVTTCSFVQCLQRQLAWWLTESMSRA